MSPSAEDRWDEGPSSPLYPGAPSLPPQHSQPLSSSPRSQHSHLSNDYPRGLGSSSNDRGASSRQNSGSSAGAGSSQSAHDRSEPYGFAGRGAGNRGNHSPAPPPSAAYFRLNASQQSLGQQPASPTARSMSPSSINRSTNRNSLQLNSSSLSASPPVGSSGLGYLKNSRPPPSPTESLPPSRPSSASGNSSHRHGPSEGALTPNSRRPERQRSNDRVGKPERTGSGPSPHQPCAKCELPMTGQFVRALGTVQHLDCFRCGDCGTVVAAKFFPIEGEGGKQIPLCERDYFRRLDLLCSKCGEALRGSYITALDHKWHTDCFSCSVCPVVFGPQDSYYEHDGKVFCHFHYSTRFAVKCTGCRTAILKQFVEINRNSEDEHWHPECYMINKFWNIKLAPSPPVVPSNDNPVEGSTAPSSSTSTATVVPPAALVESSRDASGPPSRALAREDYEAQESEETAESLKARQQAMEKQVYRIWTVLSAFEESSAACISEMLRHVSSGHYLEGVRQAEKFVLHVETLFSAIDDLSSRFRAVRAKEISHVREARMLCKKVVNFFSLLSHTHETGARKMSMTQDLLSLVTGLAHYLKILIRIALTAALKLEREYKDHDGIKGFLQRLDRLGKAPANAARAIQSNNEAAPYGYKSLVRAVGPTSLGQQGEATTDLCEGCKLTVEEECARLGTSVRWHLACLRCHSCGKQAAKERDVLSAPPVTNGDDVQQAPQPPTHASEFEIDRAHGTPRAFCHECSPPGTQDGFVYVTRLEQYAFLLCVALNKLYSLLKQRGVVPSSPDQLAQDEDDRLGLAGPSARGERSLYDTYRDSNDIKRMKSVNLDRKLSSTTARLPKRSVVVQSPSGRVADEGGKPPIPSRKDQPLLDPSRATTVPRPTLPSSQQASPQPGRSPQPGDYLSRSENNSPRPGYNRAPPTAIKIMDDIPPDAHQLAAGEGSGLGGMSEPTQDEEGLTLADLASAMEAEQAREQRRSVLPAGRSLSELSALEYFIVKHAAAVALSADNSPLRGANTLDELLELIDARKNTFWGKLFKGAGGQEKAKPVKKKGVFGIPLEVLVERNGADSMHGAGTGSVRIPSFVDDIVSAMRQMDMSIEGIFRKNGNIRRLKDLSEALDRDASAVNLAEDNPVQLAALLKRFLRDLPDPIMTFKLFHLFIAVERIESIDERKKALHLVCCLLPKAHRDTLEVLCVFLKWVASFSHVDEETGSKMDLQNLATVICPNMLYARGKDPTKDESFSAVRAVHELLEWQDELWTVPTAFERLLDDVELQAKGEEVTSKEILAKAESYARGNGGEVSKGRARGLSRAEPGMYPPRPDFNTAYSTPNMGPNRAPPTPQHSSSTPIGGPPRPQLNGEFSGSGAEKERPASFSASSPSAAEGGAYSPAIQAKVGQFGPIGGVYGFPPGLTQEARD